MSFDKYIHSKVMSIDDLMRRINLWKLQDQKIVFSNGCFDIVHKGHVEYLIAAADLGDRLIIGLNSDQSVKRLRKGASRPIQDESSRAHIIGSMAFVSAVILFDEDTPELLIQKLRPHVLVKGGDYAVEHIAGSDFVLKNGGEVKIIPLIEGYSTSAIEGRIRTP